MFVIGIGGGAAYCFYIEYVYYGILIQDIVEQFIITYVVKKVVDIFLWMSMYFLCCCKHRKKLENKKKEVELKSLDPEEPSAKSIA